MALHGAVCKAPAYIMANGGAVGDVFRRQARYVEGPIG